MSRIHEALKKAEQERAASQGGGATKPSLPLPVSGVAGMPEMASHENAGVHGSGGDDADFFQPIQRRYHARLAAHRWNGSPTSAPCCS